MYSSIFVDGTQSRYAALCQLMHCIAITHPTNMPPAPEAPSVHRQLEANLAVFLVLVVAVGPLELGNSPILWPPFRRIIHIIRPCGRERRHGEEELGGDPLLNLVYEASLSSSLALPASLFVEQSRRRASSEGRLL